MFGIDFRSAYPILYQGAEPVIDSEPNSWNLSLLRLRTHFEPRACGNMPKAVIVVNLYGQSADFDPIVEVCHRYVCLLLKTLLVSRPL